MKNAASSDNDRPLDTSLPPTNPPPEIQVTHAGIVGPTGDLSTGDLSTNIPPDTSRTQPLELQKYPYLTDAHLRSRRRRIRLPVILFVLTCMSTFYTGVTNWEPIHFSWQEPSLLQSDTNQSFAMTCRRVVIRNWKQGIAYMGCVLAIMFAHEMGHFLATIRHRIPASLPYFIPLPIAPLGTMGAVIGMDGLRANRRQLFDIGLAGPLAGLVVAIPVLWIGIQQLDLTETPTGTLMLDIPILVRFLFNYLQPPGYVDPHHSWLGQTIAIGQVNPYFMAGWVGLLITGLNMLPISQLDGGHVIYTLFGKRAHWIARAFLLAAILFIVFAEAYIWFLMLLIIVLIGTDHPPTSNDQMSLGPLRIMIGVTSLLIPILCFPPFGMQFIGI